MKIVILGVGKIGQTILSSLYKENHDIVIIDKNSSLVNDLIKMYDIMPVVGNGISREVLMEADLSKCDLFIATTNSDEHNMLSCLLAKSLGATYTVSRVRGNYYSKDTIDFIKSELEISMVLNPEFLMAQAIYNRLKLPSAIKYEMFSAHKFELVELNICEGSIFAGEALTNIKSKYNVSFLIAYVCREGKVYIPSGDFVISVNDKIGVIASPIEMQSLLKSMNILQKKVKRVMILGGSLAAIYLTKVLIRNGYKVSIIEKDYERCKFISEQLPSSVEIINADGTKQAVLEEEGITGMDAFVALTGIDEENILISYLVMNLGVPKVISKVNQDAYINIAEKLEVNSIVSANHITADLVVSHARALNSTLNSKIEKLYSLMNGVAEAIEFIVSSSFVQTDISLKELKIKPNILIAGIIRGSETIIPDGDEVLKEGDHVIIIAKDYKLGDLSDILL